MTVIVRQYEDFASTPEYAPIRAALASNLWDPVEAELRRLSHEHLTYALLSLGRVPQIEGFLQYAVHNHPNSPFAQTAMAAQTIGTAWEVRTSAPDIPAATFAEFRRLLYLAEQRLIAICAQHPGFAPAWSLRVNTARGLQVGESEARRRFTRLAKLSAHDYPAQTQMLQYLLPKWFGSWDAALSFARDCAAASPLASNCAAGIAVVHLEHWASLGGGKSSLAYMADPAVYDELRNAASRSVLHPAHRLDPIGIEAQNVFAMAFYAAGKHADAAALLHTLGGRVTQFPWEYSATSMDDLNRLFKRISDRAARGRR